jgi:hypothetical protein
MNRKVRNIIYWIATLWLALGMLSTGAVQLLHVKTEADYLTELGYPPYLMTLLGAWKIAGVFAIFWRKLPRLQEWAYAGFFFAMSGAAFSHIAMHTFHQIFPSLLLLSLTLISWYFRPGQKRAHHMETANQIN